MYPRWFNQMIKREVVEESFHLNKYYIVYDMHIFAWNVQLKTENSFLPLPPIFLFMDRPLKGKINHSTQ